MGITQKVRGKEISGSLQQINLNQLKATEILTKKTSLTATQIKALNTAPQVLVPAPGAGKVVVPIEVFAKLTYSATSFTGSNNLEYRYTTSNGAKITADMAAAFINSSADAIRSVKAIVTDATPVANAPIVAFVPTADPGGASAAGTMDIYVMYRIITM